MEEKPLINASFELFNEYNHPFDWELLTSGEFKSSGDYYYEGLLSGTFTTVTSSISGREILSSPVQVTPGKMIIVSGRFYTPSIEGTSPERIKTGFKLYYYTDEECTNPASTAYSTMAKVSLKEQGVWEIISYDRTADQIPQDATFVRIGLRACYDKDAGGTKFDAIYFDNISLQQ